MASTELVFKAVGISPARDAFATSLVETPQRNISISNYINDVRFRRAEELLAQTEHPANRISEMVGFSNPKYFYLFLKKVSGKTPYDCRKEIRRKDGGPEH